MVDRIRGMEVFVQAVEAGSFAAAAGVLGMSPQMVSRHVAEIEGRLGTRLLTRSTRNHSLTEAGRLYLEGCRRSLAEVEAAEARVAAHAGRPRGLLRVTAPVAFGAVRLVPEAVRFLDLFPEVSLDVDLTDRRVNLVEEGFDAAIRVGELADSGLASLALAPYRLVPCAAPAYLAQRGIPAHPDDLRHHACLDYVFPTRPGPPLWRFAKEGVDLEVELTARLVVNDSRSLIEAALNGAGVILAAEILLRHHLADGHLVRVLPRYEGLSRPMHLLFADRRAQVPKLRAFIDWTSEVFGRRAVLAGSPSL